MELVVSSIGLAGFERKIQLKRLFSHDAIKHVHSATPTIVGGDFNDVWSSLNKGTLKTEGFQPATKKTLTFPAAVPMRALDGIYYRGEVALERAYAGHADLARHASDHLPLIAEFAVRLPH